MPTVVSSLKAECSFTPTQRSAINGNSVGFAEMVRDG